MVRSGTGTGNPRWLSGAYLDTALDHAQASPRTFLVLSLAPAPESSSQVEQRDHPGEQPDGEENGNQSELHAERFHEDAHRLNFNLPKRAAEFQRVTSCLVSGS